MSISSPTGSSISGATDTSGTSITGTTGSSVSRTDNPLGENQFLTLMMDQLKDQDPLNPSDPTQFLSELANFSSLEQETSISSSSTASATQQASATAVQMIGHTVSYTDASGNTGSGVVSKVDITSSGPELTIGGTDGIPLSEITEVS